MPSSSTRRLSRNCPLIFVLFQLGMVLDPVGIMLITLPVFLPIIDAAGFNLFYIKGVAPPSVTMGEIYTSVIPYVIVTLIGVLLIIVFPEIALFLPNLFFGKG